MKALTKAVLSPWTIPILRVGMGLFLALWGLDKWLAVEDSSMIFSHFYRLDVGAVVIRLFGAGEILLGIALAVGIFPRVTAWLQLIVNAISTAASWKEILDPWGVLGLTEGGTHLFLASIVVMAVSIVLVLNAGTPSSENQLP